MSSLPTGDQLKTLPLRAIAAYAQRSAARVAARRLPEGCGGAVLDALRVAGHVASAVPVTPDSLRRAEGDLLLVAATLADGDGAGHGDAGRGAAYTVNAAFAALTAAAAVADEGTGSRAIRGHRAVLAAVTAAESAYHTDPAVRVGAARDFARLRRANLGAFPELGRAVDLSARGPLGPLTGTEARPDVRAPDGTDATGPSAGTDTPVIDDDRVADEPFVEVAVVDDPPADEPRRRLAEDRAALERDRAALAAELQAFHADRQQLHETLAALRAVLATLPQPPDAHGRPTGRTAGLDVRRG